MGKGTVFNVLSTGFTPHAKGVLLRAVKAGTGEGWAGAGGQNQEVAVPYRGPEPAHLVKIGKALPENSGRAFSSYANHHATYTRCCQAPPNRSKLPLYQG